MIIYVDAEHHCHTTNPDGAYREIETNEFDGKCQTYIEGHCYKDDGDSISVYMWKDYAELDAAQRKYERQLIAEYESSSILTADLQNAYEEGVASA